jgi:hypothetical protein
MTVKTFEGIEFRIHFERTADLCYTCIFPNIHEERLIALAGHNDEVCLLNSGRVVFRTGSLNRLMDYLTTYIGETEL